MDLPKKNPYTTTIRKTNKKDVVVTKYNESDNLEVVQNQIQDNLSPIKNELNYNQLNKSPLQHIDNEEYNYDVEKVLNINTSVEEEDLEKYRHELDVMINEFRHSASNTLINIKKSIKNKYTTLLQREKNIFDNIIRTKERERASFEEKNIKLTEETTKAVNRYNKMTD